PLRTLHRSRAHDARPRQPSRSQAGGTRRHPPAPRDHGPRHRDRVGGRHHVLVVIPQTLMSKQQLTLTCQVDSYRSGWTIVDFLAHRFPYHTAEGWTKRVQDQWVRVNGTYVGEAHVIKKNDEVAYTIWHHEPEVDDRYSVLFEDEHYLAVAKSGNIPVHA